MSPRSLLEGIALATSVGTFAQSGFAETGDIESIAEEAHIWGLPLWLQVKYLELHVKVARR